MNYKILIATLTVLTVWAGTGSNAIARGGGGAGGGGAGSGHGGFAGGSFRGGAFAGGGFRGSGFRRGFNAAGFRGRNFRGDRFRHRDFDNQFVFFDDFWDPFYYSYSYYGYYPYGYYPYDYGYGSYYSYNQTVYPSRAVSTGSLVSQVQLRLARAGYYHDSIDGVSGTATRRAVREYERAHGLPGDGKISQRLIATMRAG